MFVVMLLVAVVVVVHQMFPKQNNIKQEKILILYVIIILSLLTSFFCKDSSIRIYSFISFHLGFSLMGKVITFPKSFWLLKVSLFFSFLYSHFHFHSFISFFLLFLFSVSICLDSEFDDLDAPNVHFRPEALETLCQLTKFTRKELQMIYRGFKQVKNTNRNIFIL